MTPADLWRVWDAHRQAIHPYPVCAEGCRGWPCDARRDAEAALRAAGIDPYAVKRGETTLPATSTKPGSHNG